MSTETALTKSDSWNALWDSWLGGSLFPQSLAWPVARPPAVDVSEDDKEVTIKAEIPGMAQKDIEVSHEDGVLYLKGEKRDEREEKKKDYHRKESWSGSFSRSIFLGNGLDWNKTDAQFKDGVLTIRLPKVAGPETRKKITIH